MKFTQIDLMMAFEAGRKYSSFTDWFTSYSNGREFSNGQYNDSALIHAFEAGGEWVTYFRRYQWKSFSHYFNSHTYED